MSADTGHATTLTYSGVTYNLINVDWNGSGHESIETTHMGTTSWRTFRQSALGDAGQVTATYQWDPAIVPPIGDTAAGDSQMTIAWGGQGTSDIETCNGFILTVGRNAQAEPGTEMMQAEVVFKMTGAITQT